MVIQAICYVAAITYTFGFSARISEQLTGSVAFPLLVIARITNPLQGALNILIYTRLHVSRLRTNQNISWRRAFWRVISSGADHDSASSLRGNSASNERNRGQSFRRLVQSSFSKSNNSDTLNSKQKEQHEAIKIDEAVDDIENIACGEMINDDEKIDESEKVLTLSNDSHLRRKDCSNNGFDTISNDKSKETNELKLSNPDFLPNRLEDSDQLRPFSFDDESIHSFGTDVRKSQDGYFSIADEHEKL